MKILIAIVTLTLCTLPCFAQTSGVGAKTQERTVAALRSAYWTAEQNVEFFTKSARKAEAEKALGVASLFRTAAKVNAVHSVMFASRLDALKSDKGAAPTTTPQEIKGTRENLATAIKLATAARENDLPAGRKAAEGEGNNDAARSFRDAREGTIELVRFFKDASETMDQWSKAKRAFYVGRTCGYAVEKLDLTKCPVCGKGRDDFEKID